MSETSNSVCRECESVDRRSFLQTVGAAVASTAAVRGLLPQHSLWAAPASTTSTAETAVAQLFQSLSETQRNTIAFPFDHASRQRINANWHITKPLIREDFYTNGQRELIFNIVKSVTTPDGYERIEKQTEYDDGGLGAYSIAMFGDRGTGQLQFELTGRHLTLRADGNRTDKVAFGGPLVYGHGEEEPGKNLFFYQTQQVSEVFQALDAKQAEAALIEKAPKETDVALKGAGKTYPGIAYSALSADQKQLVEKTLKVLLAPYRTEDVDEVFAILKQTGGLESLHLAFYKEDDLLNDRMWDIWRVEGPSLVWHFRGAPHVHAYINVGIVG